MKRFGLVLCIVAVSLIAIGEAFGSGKSRRGELKPSSGIVKLDHIRVDLKRRQIVIDAEVCLRSGPLEFLLCGWKTKSHESVLHTRAKPSRLHGAMLLLGLTPGKPVMWVEGDDDRKGRLMPPRGAKLKISIRWKDKKGKVHLVDASEFIKPAGKKKAPSRKEWVFVGSNVLPDGKYQADLDGEIISVANFASSVIDVPFESSDKDNLRQFVANTAAIPAFDTSVNPPKGTPVEVIITPVAGAEKAPHARATLTINATGDMKLDGKAVTICEIDKWARKFIAAHAKGQVMIEADPSATVGDIIRAREQLYLGGVRFITDRWLALRNESLPRTVGQLERAMKKWAVKFGNPKYYIRHPRLQAQDVLKQINAEKAKLQTRRKLIEQYETMLQQVLLDNPTEKNKPSKGGKTKNDG